MEAGKRMKSLKLTDVQAKAEDYPCLRHVKGAKVRAFAPICQALCNLYKESRAEKHGLAMVVSLNNLYKMLDMPWAQWSEKVGIAWLQEINKMMSHYSFLAGKAMTDGLHLYSLTQKHHVLLHQGEQARWLHPKTTWCYGSESFMAIAKQMGASCTQRNTCSHGDSQNVAEIQAAVSPLHGRPTSASQKKSQRKRNEKEVALSSWAGQPLSWQPCLMSFFHHGLDSPFMATLPNEFL